MNRETWIVPKGIRYISDWGEFQLPPFPSIIDKKLTGCGFTEYVIRSSFNAILVSPRKVLLENKSRQHNPYVTSKDNVKYEIPEERTIYYAKCDWEEDLGVDKDLNKEKETKVKIAPDEEKKTKYQIFKDELVKAINMFQLYRKPIKISVTYDSFRKVKEVLQEVGIFDTFKVVVDEFQSIFTDGTFKPTTEMEFVYALQDVANLSFVSATPMIEKYLDRIPEFSSLPYFELDWKTEEKSRIKTPKLSVDEIKGSINKVFKKYITDYRNGDFSKKVRKNFDGTSEVVEAKELVFYVNSVKNICDAIKQNKLEPEQVHIICADTTENREKVREAFRTSLKSIYGKDYLKRLPSLSEVISEVPTPGENGQYTNNRPFMFCTKTVYLGADMYSKCARTIIVSDSGIESLAVDITLDLPQIMGRQRDEENPWKYEAEVWVKFGMTPGKITPEQFEARINEKLNATDNLVNIWTKGTPSEKHTLAKVYKDRANTKNYSEDYVGVNEHAGSDLKPQRNNIVWISETRAYDIQQIDYADRFAMFNRVEEVFGKNSIQTKEVLDDLDQYTTFSEKMKKCCQYVNGGYNVELIPEQFKVYIQVLGTDFILSKSGRKSLLDEALSSRTTTRIFTSEDLKVEILNHFIEGNRYLMSSIKTDLGRIYKQLGISKKAKASDLEEWFEIKKCLITNPETKKRENGFELLKKK